MWISLLLLVQLVCLEKSNSLCNVYEASLIPEMSGRISDHARIFRHQVSAHENCFKSCLDDTSCVSFFYNSVTGQCQLHSILLKPSTSDRRIADWLYWQFYSENCTREDDQILYRKENVCYFLSDERKSWHLASGKCSTKNTTILPVNTTELLKHLSMTLDYYFDYSSYLGCYKDTNNRTLPVMLKNQNMSIDWCRTKCREKHYKYAAVQLSTYCFCGDGDYERYGGSKCGSICPGNPTENCGGPWTNSVYKSGGEYFINTSFSLSSKTIGPTQHYCVSLDPLQDYHMKKVQCTDEYQFLCGKRL